MSMARVLFTPVRGDARALHPKHRVFCGCVWGLLWLRFFVRVCDPGVCVCVRS